MFATLLRDRRASVSIVGALILPLLIGMVGLVAEFGHGLMTKVEDQRVADMAAFAGATAYNATASTTTMTSVIDKVASLNGITSADVAGSLVTSPSGDGNQAVKVIISTSNSLVLSQVIGSAATLPVSGIAYAELRANAAGCVIALNSGGAGVALSGGTSVTADACAVDSNATVGVPCGDTITTIAVAYDSSSAPSQPCGGIQPPAGTGAVKILKTLTADPLLGNSGVSTATSRISAVSALTSPRGPNVTSGGDINFAYNLSSTQAQAAADGCSASFSSKTWTLTCSGESSYNFGNITLGGGISLNFNTGGSSSTTYNFSGSINNTGSVVNFGPGVYNIAKGVATGGGTTTTFGAGVYNIGAGANLCTNGVPYSICNTGDKLTFGGPSTFVLAAGVYNRGGEILTLGSGNTNSFNIGAASDGNSINVGGGSMTTFADAIGGLFQLAGNLNMGSGGGSCLTIGAASQHDINGSVTTAGGTIMGAGVYTVNGPIELGGSGGGDVTCNGSTVGMDAAGATFVTSGIHTPTSGSCAGSAFCIAAGYNHVVLTAPTSGPTAQLAVIGPTSSSNTSGAAFTEGASNTSISGAFYFPYGPISLTGGASVGNGAGQCLELIGSQVTLAGGTAAASTCISSATTSSSVVLVQ